MHATYTEHWPISPCLVPIHEQCNTNIVTFRSELPYWETVCWVVWLSIHLIMSKVTSKLGGILAGKSMPFPQGCKRTLASIGMKSRAMVRKELRPRTSSGVYKIQKMDRMLAQLVPAKIQANPWFLYHSQVSGSTKRQVDKQQIGGIIHSRLV